MLKFDIEINKDAQKFDLFNRDSWDTCEIPNEYAYLDEEELLDEQLKPILLPHIITNLRNVEDIFQSRNPDFKLSENEIRKILNNLKASVVKESKLKKEEKQKKINEQLKDPLSVSDNTKFNPFLEETFIYAKEDVLCCFEGIPFFENTTPIKYLTETDFIEYVKGIHDSKKDFKDTIKTSANMFLLICSMDIRDKILYSTLCVEGFRFTLAEKTLLKKLDDSQLKKIVEIVKKYKDKKELKKDLKTELKFLNYDFDFTVFCNLVYCNTVKSENNAMFDYFYKLKSLKNLDLIYKELRNFEYLSIYSELRGEIYDCIKRQIES